MGQVPGSLHRMSPDRTVPIPIKLHLPFQPSKRDRDRQRERQQRSSAPNLLPVIEGQEHQQQAASSSSSSSTQIPFSNGIGIAGHSSTSSSGSGASSTGSSKGSLSQQALLQQQRMKVPIVHQIMAGGNSSIVLTRGPEEIPEVYSINLLEK